METIRNYLESMFSQLPNTPEVQKAKYELAQMMEDKYNELRSEGRSDNEAIGTVIAEFGNLDELAESLGIKSYVNSQNISPNSKTLTFNEAASYLKENARNAYLTALGVLLCIIAPISPIMADALNFNGLSEDLSDAISLTVFFLLIAIAVGIFVFSGIKMSKWKYLKNQACCIDFATASKLQEHKENYRTTHALLLTVGIMLCILSVVPAIVLSSLFHTTDFTDDISGASVLFFVAIGVFMIVFTSMKKSGFGTLLNLNNAGTVGANFVPSQKEHVVYESPVTASIMSVFWPTVTCVYLCWSFLSFDWYISWIIWPVAAIIESLVKNLLGKK